jgi:hypothetical protein
MSDRKVWSCIWIATMQKVHPLELPNECKLFIFNSKKINRFSKMLPVVVQPSGIGRGAGVGGPPFLECFFELIGSEYSKQPY